jgi:spermidine synthase
LYFLFFCSGASSLIFETIFTRLLSYTFGSTAQAVSTVLAAFLGGLALGAYLLGRWVDRWKPSLRVYGVLELLVGIVCWFIPSVFGFLTRWYVALCHHFQFGPTALTLVRFGLSGAAILVPTILMGGTLPVIARYVAAVRAECESDVDWLYALNTLGAALGTILATYVLMPRLGVRATVGSACVVDGAVFLAVFIFSSAAPAEAALEIVPARPPLGGASAADFGSRAGWWLFGSAFLTGAVALGYEVVWTHVLAFLVGNTVYAFGSMLFTFLCGLGLGARAVSRRWKSPSGWGRALAGSQLLLALSVLLSVPLWSFVPALFAGGAGRALLYEFLPPAMALLLRLGYLGWRIALRPPDARSRRPWIIELSFDFLAICCLGLVARHSPWLHQTAIYGFRTELARLLCAFYLLIIPCFLLGLSFPLLLNIAIHSDPATGRRVGGLYAANSVGSILGSVGMGFGLLPWLGSLSSMRVCALLNMALGLGFTFWLVPLAPARRRVLALAACALPIVLWLVPGNWDAARMTTGSYVYFDQGFKGFDRLLYYREDVQGGLTSVIERGTTRTMLSNGKFQGDNAGQVGPQIRMAMTPALFTRKFDRALVIGLGTGNTLRALSRFPFRRIDVAELAPHVLDAARTWFQDVNGDVFDRDPRAAVHITDGRNFLLLSSERYDVITIEVSSIWIAGEADLYNQEFYQLCQDHLERGGVLQQWVQLHHMPLQNLLVILNTAARVFPHAVLFVGPIQALLVASTEPLACRFPQVDAFDRDPGVAQELEALKLPSMFSLLGEMTLDQRGFRDAVSLLPNFGLPPDFASTDWKPYLEYQTPKGNALTYDTMAPNRQFLNHLRPDVAATAAVVRDVPGEKERDLLLRYIAEGRGDKAAAREPLGRLRGEAIRK